MTTPNSGPFGSRGQKTFSGLKLCKFKYCVTLESNIAVETPQLIGQKVSRDIGEGGGI